MSDTPTSNPGLAKSTLIRELVDLSRFTEGILRTMGSAVVAVDGAGMVTYVNPAAESLLDRPAAELLNRLAESVLVTRSGAGLVGGVPGEAEGEVDLKLHDGRLVTVEARVSRHQGKHGEEEGLVVILTDRTDVKRAEEEARRKDRLASLGELSAGVAHEIRNPLAGIAAGAQLLRSRLEDGDDRVRLADMILEEAARLDRIVESLLHFARPPQPSLRESSLEKCVERGLRLVREDAARLGIEVTFRTAGDLPRLWIDPDQMVQVALNLLQNGLQSMEEGGGSLRVEVRKVSRRPYVRRRSGRRDEDPDRLPGPQGPLQDWVEVEITDTGPGIPPEVVERVFNPFYTTRRQGTGLGLPITQAIVHEHGGMISLSSEPGRGTTVLVDLPVEKRRRRRRDEA
jgi:PAS domain S-box-containing protein